MATDGTLTTEGAEEKSSATAGALVSMVEMLDAATVDCEFVLLQIPEDLRALRLRGRAGFLRAMFERRPESHASLLTALSRLRFTKGVLWKAGQLEPDDAELAHMQVKLQYKVQEMEAAHNTEFSGPRAILSAVHYHNGRSEAVDVHWVKTPATETTPMVTKRMASVQPGKEYRCRTKTGDRFVAFESGDDQRIIHELTSAPKPNDAFLRDDARAEHDALCQELWETRALAFSETKSSEKGRDRLRQDAKDHASEIAKAATPVEAHWFATAPAPPVGVPPVRDLDADLDTELEPEPEPEPEPGCTSAATGASASSNAYLAMVSSLDLPSQAASGSMQLARQRLAFAYSLRDAAADDALCLDLDVVQQVIKFVLLPNHWTTLMMAAYRGLPDQVLSVVRSGANLRAIKSLITYNNAGRSALDIARALKRQSVVAVLEAHIDVA
jgi:hypothetical protein